MSIDGGMDKDMVYIYNGILLSYKKEQNNAIWSNMDDLEIVILSEISQRKTNTVWYHLHVESKKYNRLVNTAKKKQIRRYREQISHY